MKSRSASTVSSPWWGAPREPAPGRWLVRGGLALDLLGAGAFLALWVMVWSFFIVAVAGPAARLHGAGQREAPVTSEPGARALAVAGPGSSPERSTP